MKKNIWRKTAPLAFAFGWWMILPQIQASAAGSGTGITSTGSIVYENGGESVAVYAEDIARLKEKLSSVRDEIYAPEAYGDVQRREYEIIPENALMTTLLSPSKETEESKAAPAQQETGPQTPEKSSAPEKTETQPPQESSAPEEAEEQKPEKSPAPEETGAQKPEESSVPEETEEQTPEKSPAPEETGAQPPQESPAPKEEEGQRPEDAPVQEETKDKGGEESE